MKFLAFADLHYKKGMYASSVAMLEKMLDRAAAEQVDFVIHLGDFSNDYKGSPEIVRAYLENTHNLPVYGVYGNHELESADNSVELVTPLLTNQPVQFGSSTGGYWYTDRDGFRLIGLDSNYSLSPEGVWEHNRTASHTSPKGNTKTDSLGPDQLVWLRQVLGDAAKKGLRVLVFAHASFSGIWQSSPDADAVRSLYAEVNETHPGTVILSVNGHYHTDRFAWRDGVAYWDVNTVQNGFWASRDRYHYDDSHTCSFLDYDENGSPRGEAQEIALNSLRQGRNTWFFTEPLSAVVTVEENGSFRIDGSETEWMHGVLPDQPGEGTKNRIESREGKR